MCPPRRPGLPRTPSVPFRTMGIHPEKCSSRAAFVAEHQGTSQPTAKQTRRSLAAPGQRFRQRGTAANTPYSRSMGGSSASPGPVVPPAISGLVAAISTVAASVEIPRTAQAISRPRPDPRRVVTPLNPDKAEKVLHNLGLFNSFRHIIVGLREGFDVGIRGLLPRTYLFQQSQIILSRPRFISSYIAGEQAAGRIPKVSHQPSWKRPSDRSYLTIEPGAQAPLRQAADGSRYVISAERPRGTFSKCWSKLGRLSYGLGHIRQYLGINLVAPTWLRCSHIRYICGISFDTITPRPACTLCVLGRTCLRGSSRNVRAFIKCWCFWVCRRYASRNLRSGWIGLIKKWVDDFLASRLPHQSWTEADFIGLTAEFGVPGSLAKTRLFAEIQRYIGFDWDLRSRSVSLPAEKRTAILDLLRCWQLPTNRFSAHDAASLHGKLVHVACIYPLIRPFLKSASDFSTSFIPLAHIYILPRRSLPIYPGSNIS